MVEWGRFAQVEALVAEGWNYDDHCDRLAWADESVGGPSFVRDPGGRVHAVSCDKAEPLHGFYPYWAAELPATAGASVAMRESNPSTITTAIFTNGGFAGIWTE